MGKNRFECRTLFTPQCCNFILLVSFVGVHLPVDFYFFSMISLRFVRCCLPQPHMYCIHMFQGIIFHFIDQIKFFHRTSRRTRLTLTALLLDGE